MSKKVTVSKLKFTTQAIKVNFCAVVKNAEITDVDVKFGELKAKFYSQESFDSAREIAGFNYRGIEYHRAKSYQEDKTIYYLFHKSL